MTVGADVYRSTIERRPAASSVKESKKTKTKQNKTNVTLEKDNMTSASKKTHGGYKLAPLVANQLWRANQHENACFGRLSSPCLGPCSRHVRAYDLPESSIN